MKVIHADARAVMRARSRKSQRTPTIAFHIMLGRRAGRTLDSVGTLCHVAQGITVGCDVAGCVIPAARGRSPRQDSRDAAGRGLPPRSTGTAHASRGDRA